MGTLARDRPRLLGTTQGIRAVVRAGVLAGLLGGALMALVVTGLAAATASQWHPLRDISATLLGTDALAGGPFAMLIALALHAVTSAAWGIAFASAVGRRPRGVTALALGLLAAEGIMIVMTFGVLPKVNPMMYTNAMMSFGSWTTAHLAYGIGLAFAPWLRSR